jgi:hypothetical protein
MAMKKKRRTKARRRSNPVPVIFANPRKRRRRRRRSNPTRHPRSWLKSAAPKRRRRRRHAAPHARRRARFKRVGVRRYDRKRRKAVQFRKPYRRSRSGRMVRVRRLYRRSNPTSLKGIAGLIRPCLFGGLGVITARIGKHLYQKYAQSMVAGDGSSTVRGYLNEALGLASMALITIGVEKGLKKVPGVRHEDCTAFRFGGFGETGRQLIGVVVKKVRPSTDLANWGLNGSQNNPYNAVGNRTMGELEDSDSFMGELEDLDSFQGAGGPFVIQN